MARKDHPGIPLSSGPYAAVAKLTESLKSKVVGHSGYWTVVSERASILFSHTFRTLESALYFAMKLFFSGDITSWTGKWRLPCMEDYIPPLPPLLLRGAHAALTPYKPRASSSSGPWKTEDQAAQAPFTKN